jgi:hypothetical protein
MITGELLIKKGFKLNTYPEGKFYEFETKDEEVMQRILGDDYYEDTNIVILHGLL